MIAPRPSAAVLPQRYSTHYYLHRRAQLVFDGLGKWHFCSAVIGQRAFNLPQIGSTSIYRLKGSLAIRYLCCRDDRGMRQTPGYRRQCGA